MALARTDKRSVLREIAEVRKQVVKEMGDHSGGKYARGLASEGFAGGYLMALDDIDAALRHGYPSDHRGYWAAARRALKAATVPAAEPAPARVAEPVAFDDRSFSAFTAVHAPPARQDALREVDAAYALAMQMVSALFGVERPGQNDVCWMQDSFPVARQRFATAITSALAAVPATEAREGE